MTTMAGHAPPPYNKKERQTPLLRLGPVARSHTMIDKGRSHATYLPRLSDAAAPPTEAMRYPRIVVRDPLGRRLDTFTTLQDAIYRASWSRKKMGEWPKTALQWRLPKAPVPSKPDFSRMEPRAMTSLHWDLGQHHNMTSRSHDVSSNVRRLELTADMLVNAPTMEIPVDDVAFVAESLNHLPTLPSFSFLRHSILAGKATYVQIVASILLHQRQLRSTDQRDASWEFPGFCSGCKRAGFCYGCRKNPKPHVHEDIPARTGGGFRYWKRDRPRDPHDWKHPSNWRLPSTEQELRDIIERYGGLAAYEQAVVRARQEVTLRSYDPDLDDVSLDHSSKKSHLQRLKNLSTYPPYVTIVSTDDFADGLRIDDGEEDGFRDEDLRDGSMKVSLQETREDDEYEEEEGDEEEEEEEYDDDDDDEKERQPAVSVTERVESESSDDRMLVKVDTGYFDQVSDDDQQEERTKVSTVDSQERQETRGEEDPWQSRRVSRAQASSSHAHSQDSGRSRHQSQTSPDRRTSRFEYVDKQKELEANEEARLRREPPKFFTVQKRQRRITVAKDPFSTDRELNLPRGPAFELKKSSKKTTQFVDFQRGDRNWKPPKKFELQHGGNDEEAGRRRKLAEAEGGRRKGRRGDGESDDQSSRNRRPRELSPDSGVDSSTPAGKDGTDGCNGKDGSGSQDDADGVGDGKQGLEDRVEGGPHGAEQGGAEADGHGDEKRPRRREIVKKSRVERVSIVTPPESPLPQPPSPVFRRRSPTWTPSPPRTPSPELEEPPLPEIEIDAPAMPDLPDIGNKSPEKRRQKQKFTVQPPPPLPQAKEEPRKRKPPPKIRTIPRHLSRPRRSRPAEAPVTSEELLDIQDPLDFLAKWCIINPDRLPFYEIVFESTVAEQVPRYDRPPPWKEGQTQEGLKEKVEEERKTEEEKDEKTKKGKSKKKKKAGGEKDKQTEINPNLFPADRGMNIQKVAMTMEEQHLEKLIYTLDLLQDKMQMLGEELEELEARRIQQLAGKARETYPLIASPEYFPKKKKGKKGKKKDKQLEEPTHKLKPQDITDEVIVGRLDDKQFKELSREHDIKMLDVETEILREKIREVQRRVEEMAREKLLADAFCMNHYFLRQGLPNSQSEDFKRQQSELYNRLNPNPDYEMNLEEVEEALQQINNHLLTEKEFHFLYNILDLPGRKTINFRLFTVIAALSEKVTQLDPVIRKLINNFNYNALDVKMEKCKELFELLEDEHMPRGAAQAASLAVELTAGGLRPEHTKYVLNKFNRESKGSIDFLDFVTYVPLFVEIHKRIIQDPLKQDLDL